ncbi:MAG: cobalamin B12-binding domain-containing protein [Chloroflexi bacterium]|nr:cobalamin B12-binding domain-containing protein [Chloroflexota bacterium]
MPAELSDAPMYNTSAVVRRTRVPAVTFIAWERRYGFPKPARDPTGRRLYSARDVRAISWLAEQTRQGVAISRAIAMLHAGHAPPDNGETALSREARSFDVLRQELLAALLGWASGQADALLAEAFALYSLDDVCQQLLQPVLVDVGDRWHAGQVSVADEHYVSSFVRTWLFSLLHTYDRADTRSPLIVTACAPEEWHEVGILVISVMLVRRGYAVRYLGPNLPLDGLAAAAARHRPELVIVSAQSRETALHLRQADPLLRSGPSPRPRFAFGGQAFNLEPSLRERVSGTYLGPDAAAAVEAVPRLVARSGSESRRTSASTEATSA